MEKQNVLKTFGGFSIGPVIGAVLGLISTPLFTYFLSPSEYGKASMFSVALTIIQLIVFLGMDQAYIKKYYETDDRSILISNAMVPSYVLVIIIEASVFLLRRQISFLLFGSENELLCVYAIMVVMPSLAVERFALLSIRMEQRSVLYSTMMILVRILVMIITVLSLVIWEKSFRSIVWGQVIAQIVYTVILFILQHKEMSLRITKVDIHQVCDLLRFGLPLVSTAVIGWALNGTDKIMMRAMSDYSEIGLYSVALKIASALAIIQSSFTTFWAPVAHQWNNDNIDTSRFSKIGRITAYVMATVFIFVLLIREVVFVLFKPEYSEAARIVPFLLFHPIMYTISEVTVMGIYFKEKTSRMALISLMVAIINIGLNALLIPKLGANGAAIATGLSYICFFWGRTLLSRKLWYPFKIEPYIVTTVLLVIASITNTVITGWIPYFVDVILLIILFLYFRRDAEDLFAMLFSAVKGSHTKAKTKY